MGRISSGVKAGLVGGLIPGIIAGITNYLLMTIFKEEYMKLIREALTKAFEKYGGQIPPGMDLEQLVEVSYNTGRIFGSVGAIVVFVVVGAIVGIVYALIYNKLPTKSPILKALILTLATYVIWSAFSTVTSFNIGLPVLQWISTLGHVVGFIEYVLLGITMGALYYKWYVSTAE